MSFHGFSSDPKASSADAELVASARCPSDTVITLPRRFSKRVAHLVFAAAVGQRAVDHADFVFLITSYTSSDNACWSLPSPPFTSGARVELLEFPGKGCMNQPFVIANQSDMRTVLITGGKVIMYPAYAGADGDGLTQTRLSCRWLVSSGSHTLLYLRSLNLRAGCNADSLLTPHRRKAGNTSRENFHCAYVVIRRVHRECLERQLR
ncbi:hypothetical protein MSAN_00880100 [Mycena sanguinolenta]|uniref:Uncharacterized protein n=1 Tax=Mycena sanguinolenta TaxID=230812 RepID=A0A8H6YX98_9AGAR|nr:hypothetical protein MSAN_00880100 [Mycena sanguinolenta]